MGRATGTLRTYIATYFVAVLVGLVVTPLVNGSLEASGRTAAHLGRLMEEHGIATLSAPTGQHKPIAGASYPVRHQPAVEG